MPPIIVIAGPTGSGKSALALRLAEEFAGEVIHCDSMQLYRGFDIGTAKVPREQRRGIPHHLIDVIDLFDKKAVRGGVYSAGDYARDARRVIEEVSARGHLPIVAGGTGFYLRALLRGLPELPPRDESLRQRLASRENSRPGALHRILSRLDPAAAKRIHPHDRPKLIRALEIRLLTSHPAPPSDTADRLSGFRTLLLGLDPDRAALYKFLDARAHEMFRSGLIEEVKHLIQSGANGDEKPFESLGYKQALAYLRGSLSLEEAVALTALETRRYAKRQWTWFRREKGIVWLRGFGGDPEVIDEAIRMVAEFTAGAAPRANVG
jgi:tRNA dimethylallyltransferase